MSSGTFVRMADVTRHEGELESLALSLGNESTLVLAPERGGIATRLRLGGAEIFYLDRATLLDPTKNVRGGNPVLFPQPGKLEGDAYEARGARYTMKQHGFARTLPWSVARTAKEPSPSATLTLTSSDATRALYPWDFRAEYTYTLTGRAMRVDMSFTHTGTSGPPMPFGAGFHPYFLVPDADKGRVVLGTEATRGFDNVTKTTGPVALDLTRDELDVHLDDHGDRPFSLTTPSYALALRASPAMWRWVVWTLAGKDFVCVEPWTCAGNALGTGESLLRLEPGQRLDLFMEIERTA